MPNSGLKSTNFLTGLKYTSKSSLLFYSKMGCILINAHQDNTWTMMPSYEINTVDTYLYQTKYLNKGPGLGGGGMYDMYL